MYISAQGGRGERPDNHEQRWGADSGALQDAAAIMEQAPIAMEAGGRVRTLKAAAGCHLPDVVERRRSKREIVRICPHLPAFARVGPPEGGSTKSQVPSAREISKQNAERQKS